MDHVIIIVRSGTVQGVWAGADDVEIEVLDFDTTKGTDRDELDVRFAELEADPNWKPVYQPK